MVYSVHCLAHLLTGAPNTDYPSYPGFSQESSTCNNTPMAMEMQNVKFCCHVSIFAIFVTTPKRVVTTNKYFLMFCIKNVSNSCTVDIHQLTKKYPNCRSFMERNLLNVRSLFVALFHCADDTVGGDFRT